MFFLKHSYLYCPVCDTFSTCYDNTNTLYMIETAVNLYTTSVWLDIFSRRLFQQHSGMWSEVWGMADIRNLLHRLTMLHLNNNISWKRNSLLNNCYLVMLTNVSNTVFWVLNTLSLQISADPVSKFPDVTHWQELNKLTLKITTMSRFQNTDIHTSTATRWAEAVALSEGFNSLSN